MAEHQLGRTLKSLVVQTETAFESESMEASEIVQITVVWNWAMHLGVPQRALRELSGCFPHERRVMLTTSLVRWLP